MVDASSQATKVSAQEREQMDSLQAKGAKTAFMLLDESKQREYVEAAFSELAAFANWRRSQVAQQDKGDLPPATEFEGCWDLLDEEQKLEWVPQDAKAFLAADLQFANLVTTPFGEEAKKAFKGETAAKVPVKEETKKSVPGKEVIDQKVAKVKEEPGIKAVDPKPKPKAVVKHELKPSTAATQKATSAPQKAVVVKQEPKQIVPAEPKKAPDAAPNEKAKPIQKQELPKEKVVVKKELKKTDTAQPAKTVKKTEAPKEKAKPVQKQEVSKEKAVEVKKEPVQTPANPQVEKPSSKVKAVETTLVQAEQPKPAKEKAARAKKTKETTSEPAKKPAKAKAKSRVVSLEQRLQKKSRAVEDDEEEEQLMALVPRSDDADDADVAEAPVKEISKPRGRKEAPRAPPGRMVVNRQCRGPAKAVAENLFPEALEATCCKCNQGSVTADNDLAMCDRCDKAFHQKCHEPSVAYFGNPEDQWFCSQCTLKLAQMRKLNLKVEDFCWVQATGETMSWPARVLRIDFSSLADPKPYWVQFFDSGPPEGAWVGEIHVKPWTEGPSYGSIVQARRRSAVGLAEAAGAEKISTEPRKRNAAGHKQPSAQDAENPHRRRRAVAEDLDKARPRRSRRGEVDVPLLTEPTSVRVPAVCAKQVPATQGMESPQRKRKAQDADPASTEKQRRVDTVDPEAQSKIAETCDLIAELKEQQRQIDEALAQQDIS